jgi:Holliday junction DNA helicase RuvA
MIRFLKGTLMSKTDRGLVVLSNGVGYEVELPVTTRRIYAGKSEDEDVKLYISYRATQQNPVPRLFGFDRELERDFFEELIDVSEIGGSTALDAMSIPVPQIARAIVNGDAKTIRSLKGIGEKKADMIIAKLKRRVAKYALLSDDAVAVSEPVDFKVDVRETLVKQLQFKPQEAQRLIDLAIKETPAIKSAEELFDEVLRLHK